MPVVQVGIRLRNMLTSWRGDRSCRRPAQLHDKEWRGGRPQPGPGLCGDAGVAVSGSGDALVSRIEGSLQRSAEGHCFHLQKSRQ